MKGAGTKASMGPHSFKCGKFDPPFRHFGDICVLQWGRTLSSAESLRVQPIRIAFSTGFNGAALFQVRKGIQREKSAGR